MKKEKKEAIMGSTIETKPGEIYYTTNDRVVVRKKAVREIHPETSSIRLSGGLYIKGVILTGEIDEKDIPEDCTIIR